jgi:hypothetical protein
VHNHFTCSGGRSKRECGKDLRELDIANYDSAISSWLIDLLNSTDQERLNGFSLYFSAVNEEGGFQLDRLSALQFAYYCLNEISEAAKLFHRAVIEFTKEIHPRYFLCGLLKGYGRTKQTAREILALESIDYLPADCPGLTLTTIEAMALFETDRTGLNRMIADGVLYYTDLVKTKMRIVVPNFNFLMMEISNGSTSARQLLGQLLSLIKGIR